MLSRNEAFLFLLEVDKELADGLGEQPLASEIATSAAATSDLNRPASRALKHTFWDLVREDAVSKRSHPQLAAGRPVDTTKYTVIGHFEPMAPANEPAAHDDLVYISPLGIESFEDLPPKVRASLRKQRRDLE